MVKSIKKFWKKISALQKVQLCISFIPYWSSLIILCITYISLSRHHQMKNHGFKLILMIIPIFVSMICRELGVLEMILVALSGMFINIYWIKIQTIYNQHKE